MRPSSRGSGFNRGVGTILTDLPFPQDYRDRLTSARHFVEQLFERAPLQFFERFDPGWPHPGADYNPSEG